MQYSDLSTKEFSYYYNKFQRRLLRHLIQYETLLDHLPETLHSKLPGILEILTIEK